MQSPLPYNEDYYYQTYLNHKLGNKRRPPLHTPLCDSGPPQPTRKRAGSDPFKGALGRIPNHSVRSPRPLVQLDDFCQSLIVKQRKEEAKAKEEAEGGVGGSVSVSGQLQAVSEEGIEGEAGGQSQSGEGKEGMGRYRVLLKAEEAYNVLLDIEDLDLLIATAASVEPQTGMQLLGKRMDLAGRLLAVIHISTQPPQKPPPAPASPLPPPDEEHDEDDEAPISCSLPEDELFVRLIETGKGRRLLLRSLPVLGQNLLFFILLAFMRNLHPILTFPKTKEEIQGIARLCYGIVQSFGMFGLGAVASFLHTFIAFGQVEAIKTKSGIMVLKGIFSRAHQLVFAQTHANFQDYETTLWEETFKGFLEGLSGYFCALLRLAADEEAEAGARGGGAAGEAEAESIFVSMAHVWDLLLLLTAFMNNEQKENLFLEISEPVQETLLAGQQHRGAIFALLQRLGKEAFVLHFLHAYPQLQSTSSTQSQTPMILQTQQHIHPQTIQTQTQTQTFPQQQQEQQQQMPQHMQNADANTNTHGTVDPHVLSLMTSAASLASSSSSSAAVPPLDEDQLKQQQQQQQQRQQQLVGAGGARLGDGAIQSPQIHRSSDASLERLDY